MVQQWRAYLVCRRPWVQLPNTAPCKKKKNPRVSDGQDAHSLWVLEETEERTGLGSQDKDMTVGPLSLSLTNSLTVFLDSGFFFWEGDSPAQSGLWCYNCNHRASWAKNQAQG